MRMLRWSLNYRDRKIVGGWNGSGDLRAFNFPKDGLLSVSIEENLANGPKEIASVTGSEYDRFVWVRNGKISGNFTGTQVIETKPIALELISKKFVYTANIYEA